ncbi:hypothetical protein K449DRAFT_432674 [Hypoxylon sp. EC38]|nr:hypothetical protein K449DRAFT_432674 [Hypoxylon sp. EC38]
MLLLLFLPDGILLSSLHRLMFGAACDSVATQSDNTISTKLAPKVRSPSIVLQRRETTIERSACRDKARTREAEAHAQFSSTRPRIVIQ